MIEKIRYILEAIPGFGLCSIAAKEINLIKTQKIALALILLYPVIVIGTLGAAFSGSGSLGRVDVAFYSPSQIRNFDANSFTSKLSGTGQVNLIPLQSEDAVGEAIRARKAKLGIIVHEPEPTQGRYVIDILNDNSNINRAVFFFQVANDSVRRVGFDITREMLAQIWANLADIKLKLGGEISRVDSFIGQLDRSETELLDLNRQINALDISEMRKKLGRQEATLQGLDPKIDSFGVKITAFSAMADSRIAAITQTQQKLVDYKSEIRETRNQVLSVKSQLDTYKEILDNNPETRRAYEKVISADSMLQKAEADLDTIGQQLGNAKADLANIKTELAATQSDMDSIKNDFQKAKSDLNYFNDQLNYLGKTVDKMNSLIVSSLENKRKVKADLEKSMELMDGFVSKLDELNALSPQFLANPIIINKVNAFDASNLQIITPTALVLVLLLTTLLLTGVSFIVERNEGSYSRLVLSPTGKLEIFAGKILGQMMFAMAESAIILAIAVFGFGVKIASGLPDLFIGLCVISFSFISLGLFITNYTRIQSTTILAGLLVVIPMIFISGILIPVELMSEQIQAASSFQPLTLGVGIATELVIKGTGIQHLVPEMMQLIIPALIFFGFTVANRNL